jgi:ketosteroid isomerase-like protein
MKIHETNPMRTLSFIAFALALFTTTAHASTPETTKITQDELVRRTQELFDAVAIGNQAPWKACFAEDTIYTDETGKIMDKPALVANISPLPKGYSGTIKVVKPQSRIQAETAVLTYDLDESETVFGQVLHAHYHGTDTWLFRNGRWQIVAGQMLRYYEDPAIGKIDTARLDDFVGTYELAPNVTITVSREGDQLYSKRGDAPKAALKPESPDLFFRPGIEGRRLFRRNDSSKVDALIDRRNNEDLIWKKL